MKPQSNNQNVNQAKTPLCLRCNIYLQPVAQFPMRIGGSTGAALFFLDSWAEINERIITFDCFRCPNCRKLEFFDLDGSLPNY